MVNIKKVISLAVTILCTTTLIYVAGCKKDSTSPSSATVSGKVIDENNLPIAGASVKSGTSSTTSDANGEYTLTGATTNSSINITATANGYFTAYRNALKIDASATHADIMMMTKTTLGSVSSSAGGTVSATGITVIAQSNGFKTSSGTVYSGTVHVSARFISKENANIAQLMPGGDFLATDTNGNKGGMRSFGFTATEFTDDAGNTLIPVGGQVVAGVTLPTSTPDPITNNANLWVYNPVTGMWNYGGSCTSQSGQIFFPVTTLYHNIDAFYATGTFEGRIVNCQNQPIPFVKIKIWNQNDAYITTTNGNGLFRVDAEASGNIFSLTVIDSSYTTTIGSVPQNQTNSLGDVKICNSSTTSALATVLTNSVGKTWNVDNCIKGTPHSNRDGTSPDAFAILSSSNVRMTVDTGVSKTVYSYSGDYWKVLNSTSSQNWILIYSLNNGSFAFHVSNYTSTSLTIDNILWGDFDSAAPGGSFSALSANDQVALFVANAAPVSAGGCGNTVIWTAQ